MWFLCTVLKCMFSNSKLDCTSFEKNLLANFSHCAIKFCSNNNYLEEEGIKGGARPGAKHYNKTALKQLSKGFMVIPQSAW